MTGILNFNNAGTTDNNRILVLYKQIVDSSIPQWETDTTPIAEGTKAFANLSCGRLQALERDAGAEPVRGVDEAIALGFKAHLKHLQQQIGSSAGASIDGSRPKP